MNQQAKDGLSQMLGKTPEDGRPKMEVETKDVKAAPDVTTKRHLAGGKQGCLSRNCSRKRERFLTAIVEYGEREVRELLALERPKKKKDTRKVWCFNCKEHGHYAKECPEENNKANRPSGVKKNLSHITCYTCKQQGHYSYLCTEESTSRPQ
jgi:hypothetical protein